MSNIYTSADQLIGKTPLLELTHIEKEQQLEARILAKLEYFNPGGSVKDRVALAMIEDPGSLSTPRTRRYIARRRDLRSGRTRTAMWISLLRALAPAAL